MNQNWPRQALPIKSTIILMGPLPPPFGGVASIVSLLSKADFQDLRIETVKTSIKTKTKLGRWGHRFFMLLKLLTALIHYRPKGIVFFSGANNSFWEKSAWAMIARLLGSRPSLVMIDGTFPWFVRSLGSIRYRILQELFKRFASIGVQSKFWLEFYRQVYPKGCYSVIVGGVDHEFFSPSPCLPRSQYDKVRILYVGWMIELKGVYDLIKAAAILKREGLSFEVRLVGPLFDQRPHLMQVIKELEIENEVVIVGQVPTQDGLLSEYQKSDIFVLVSHAEGFANAALEAMAVGLPVVLSEVGGNPDMVESGISGVLVPPKAPIELTKELSSLIRNPYQRKRLGEAARARVLNYYTLNHTVQSYKELFGYFL